MNLAPLDAASLFIAMAKQPESWVFRALVPDWRWDLNAQLLARIGDIMDMSVWMQSKDGAKGRNRPKPLPRPGVKGYRRPGEKKQAKVPNFAEIDRQLARPRVELPKPQTP
jgi:hypothetical protein